MAGVGGLFFDIFFQKSSLDRRTTNATKASAQTFSHILRGAYFGSLAGFGDLHAEIWAPAIGLAILGAIGAPYVLERMTDTSFRKWTLVIIYILATVYLIRGGWLFWQDGFS